MPTNPYQQQADEIADRSQMQPVTQEFDEARGVAGRVDSLVKPDSPLMQTAATRAAQAANARGLRNSSMAVQAGQQAVIETATPIATADANLSQQQNLANQQARNTAGQTNATLRANLGGQGMSLMEQARQHDGTMGLQRDQLSQQDRHFTTNMGLQRDQLSQQDRQFTQTTQLDRDQMAQNLQIARMDAASRRELMELEAGYRRDIAGNENIANAWGTMMQNVNQIQNNPDLDENARRISIDNQLAAFRSFTNFWSRGGAVDVSDLLDFGTAANPVQVPPPSSGSSGGAPRPPWSGSNNPNGSPWRDGAWRGYTEEPA